MSEENKNKKKFPLWIYPETREIVIDWYKKDNCQSQSEFIEKAIKFYCGYISAEEGVRFLPAAITSAMTGYDRQYGKSHCPSHLQASSRDVHNDEYPCR